MAISSLIQGLRKLGHLLTGIFPAAGRIGLHLQRWIGIVLSNPVVAPIWNRIVDSRQGQALLNVIQRFWWRDYAHERVDATPITPEAASVLRPTMILGVALALLAPIALLVSGSTPVISQVGMVLDPAPAWSIVLWILALSFAWGGVLVCGAASNRVTFIAATLLFLLFMVYFSAIAPLSKWNLLVPAIAIVGAAISQARLGRSGTRAHFIGALTCAAIGMFSGFLALGMIPMDDRPLWLKISVGSLLAAMAFVWGELARSGNFASGILSRPRAHRAFQIFSALVLLFLLSVWLRSDLAHVAGSIVDTQNLWTGYLWPVWYLLGTGIIFKLLKHAKVLTSSVNDILPHWLLVPCVVLFFLLTTIVAWSESVYNTPAAGWPIWLYGFMTKVYGATYSLVWSEFIYALAANIMRWVLLFELAAAAWLAIRRRLTTATATTLLFHTLLAWFACTQYYLNISGFARGGEPSALAVLAIGVMILWLMTRVGLGLAMKSSPWWPTAARIAFFSSIVLLLLLEIHSRAAVHDASTLDRIFFFMFRGLLEFGLPYFLLIYAGRRLPGDLPLPIPRLMAAFAVGAAGAMIFNAADTLIVVGGSVSALLTELDARLLAVFSGDLSLLVDMAPQPPFWWLVARALLAAVLLVAVAGWFRRRYINQPEGPAALIFIVVGVATGLASFSQAKIDLPLISPFWAHLFAPHRWSNELDANVFALYLSYWIPALVVALTFARRGPMPRARWLLTVAAAFVLLALAFLLWPAAEAWLHASGMLFTVMLLTAGAMVLLIRLAGNRIEHTLSENEAEPDEKQQTTPVVGPRALVAVSTLAVIVGVAIGIQQIRHHHVVQHGFAGASFTIGLPAQWDPVAEAPPEVIAYARDSVSGGRSLLFLEVNATGHGGLDAVVADSLAAAPSLLPGFELLGPTHSWARFHRRALVQDFFYSQELADGLEETMIGSALFVELDDGAVLVATLLANLYDGPRRRWDLAVLAERLPSAR